MTLVFGFGPFIGGFAGLLLGILCIVFMLIRAHKMNRPLPAGYVSTRPQVENVFFFADLFDALQDHLILTPVSFFGIPIIVGAALGFIIENIVMLF
jgi:hypothetical protein